MIANDIADRRVDARFRPSRPIPSGSISLRAASILCLLFFSLALALAQDLPTAPRTLSHILISISLLYNFGGKLIREWMGPALLATARAGSLCLGALASLNVSELASSGILWPAVVYSLFFLFTSRLAAHEECGTSGMRGLAFVLVAVAAPLLLFNSPIASISWIPLWLLLGVWLLEPLIPDRHSMWEPEKVQRTVRRSLSSAPLIHSMALLSLGLWYPSLGGALTLGLVHYLARQFPPE